MARSIRVRKAFLLGTGQPWLFQNFLGRQAPPLVSGNLFSLGTGAAQDLLGTSGAMEPMQLLFFLNGRKVRAPGPKGKFQNCLNPRASSFPTSPFHGHNRTP